jgi:asparagine synthase (glutamine-hydrolysing)
MCGVAGIARWDGMVDATRLSAMESSLRHRGPDAMGQQLLAGGHIGLVHRRLSILDLSEAAAQPMTDASRSLWLSFNGMISNFRELRAELVAKGHAFRSDGDTEVILAAYAAWGTDSFPRLRGMFAFALWDDRSKTLFLVRDHFGIKPLYVAEQAGGVVFGSEVKSLLASGMVGRDLHPAALRDFFYYRYVPHERTILRGVEKLPPASYREYRFNGGCDRLIGKRQCRYWSPTFARERYNENRFVAQVEEILVRSVNNNLVSDVPMGIFLSGGYDSATVAEIASRSHGSLNTYSIGFSGWDRSEHLLAAETAACLGTRHHTTILDVEVSDIFEEGAECYDDPFGGTSFWPTKRLCAIARREITVALGGDGGDEIFAGYNWYPKSGTLGHEEIADYLKHMHWGHMSGDEVAELCSLSPQDRQIPGELLESSIDRALGGVKALQKLDLETFLPDVVLAKVDRAAMAHGLELRVPFLDPDLADYVFSADEQLYQKSGLLKPTLQRIVEPRLGNLLTDRPKQGFSAPLQNYIPFERLANDVRAGYAIADGVVNRGTVEKLIASHRYQPILALRIFEAWYARWMKPGPGSTRK